MSVFDGLNEEQRPGVSDAEYKRLNPPVSKAKHPYVFLPVAKEAVEEFLRRRIISPSYGTRPHDETYIFSSTRRNINTLAGQRPELVLLANGQIVTAPNIAAHSFSEVSLLDTQFYFSRINLDLAIVRFLNFQLDPTALGRDHEGRPIQPQYDLPSSDRRFYRKQLRPLDRDGLIRFLRKDESVFEDMTIHHKVDPKHLAEALLRVRGEKQVLIRPASTFRSAKYVTRPWELVSSEYDYDDDPRQARVTREGLTLDKDGNLFGTTQNGPGRAELYFGGYLMSDILINQWRDIFS